jgi:hypothetical protein
LPSLSQLPSLHVPVGSNFVQRRCKGKGTQASADGQNRGGFGLPGPRVRHRHLRRISCSELLAARVVVPGGRLPCLLGQRLQVAAAGRHTSLRLQDRLRRRPSMSEAANLIAQLHNVVNRA